MSVVSLKGFVLLAWISFGLSSVLYADKFCSRDHGQDVFLKDEFHDLNTARVETYTVYDIFDCTFECLSNPFCQSLNLAASKQADGKLWCDLLSSTKYSNPDEYKENASSHHYSIKTPLLHTPCQNGATCVPNIRNCCNCKCKGGFVGKYCEACQGQALSVADRNVIPDHQMTASSYYSSSYYPYYARLNQHLGSGGWTSSTRSPPGAQYLQVDMGALHSVCSVATQGAAGISEWTTSYKLHFSSDEVTWNVYKENNAEKVFPGNTDRNSIVKNSLDTAVTARYVRFYYETYYSWPAIRVEIYVVK